MLRLDRGAMSRSASGFGHYQIVAMNDLIAATVPEDLGNFTTLVAGEAPNIGARIGRKAAADLAAGRGTDNDGVAALERAFDRDQASRQQTGAAAERPGCAVIDNNRAGRIDRSGDPRLARRPWPSPRQEQCRSGACLDRGERAR